MRAPAGGGGAEQPLKEIGLSPPVKEGRGRGRQEATRPSQRCLKAGWPAAPAGSQGPGRAISERRPPTGPLCPYLLLAKNLAKDSPRPTS